MKTTISMALIVLCGGMTMAPLGAMAEVQSLRGAREVQETAPAPEVEKLIPDQKPIKRDFVQQPPLIPHKIEGYTVTRQYNKCLSCHSWANYKAAGATKISPTHFVDRDGTELANLAPRRYFCTQCHVVQVDVEPLIENTFEPLPSINP